MSAGSRYVLVSPEMNLPSPKIRNFFLRSEAFIAAKVNKNFSGYQPCQMVKNYRHFKNHLYPYYLMSDSYDGG